MNCASNWYRSMSELRCPVSYDAPLSIMTVEDALEHHGSRLTDGRGDVCVVGFSSEEKGTWLQSIKLIAEVEHDLYDETL